MKTEGKDARGGREGVKPIPRKQKVGYVKKKENREVNIKEEQYKEERKNKMVMKIREGDGRQRVSCPAHARKMYEKKGKHRGKGI